MLSDEMTTGSVTTTDAEKRLYASRSHAWNLQQKRFKEAFPEVSVPSDGSIFRWDGGHRLRGVHLARGMWHRLTCCRFTVSKHRCGSMTSPYG